MAVRKYQEYDYQDYNYYQENTQTQKEKAYQNYSLETEAAPKLKELLFFVTIAAFCILTILFSFVFLSLQMHTFFSVGLAIAASLATIQAYRSVMTKKLVDE